MPEGVRAILRFNWPFYAAAAFVAILSAALIPVLRGFPRLAAVATLIVSVYFAAASMFASYLVYGRSGVYRWKWLEPLIGNPRRILNVHAGYDETTSRLREAHFAAIPLELRTADNTASIERARRVDAHMPAPRFAAGGLPCRPDSCNAILFLFAAHEMRRPEERDRCFADVATSLAGGGRVVVLEHLRDARTFAVFGPGAMHFYSRKEWLRSARAGGLTLVRESDLTPFAHFFVFERAQMQDGWEARPPDVA
jgi:hypothetical protein